MRGGNLAEQILYRAEGFLLDDVVYNYNKAKPTVVVIGAQQEDGEAASTLMNTAITGIAAKTYTVPAGKKAIPYKLIVKRISYTVDKQVIVALTETAAHKVECKSIIGQAETTLEYPFSDHTFAAGKVIKLYLQSEGGADALIVQAIAVLIVMPA